MTHSEAAPGEKKSNTLVVVSIIIAFVLIGAAWQGTREGRKPAKDSRMELSQRRDSQGIELPIGRESLLSEMIRMGVIDWKKFEEIYRARGGFSEEEKQLLADFDRGAVRITKENANMLLNLLWAFGLANTNTVLEKGPMMNPQYGGAGNFASTGGWTLSRGHAMDHYSRHRFIFLTPDEQALVETMAKTIYRICCDNPTHFPDCNHGMAMLGLLQLLAAGGAEEETMYRAARAVSSLWFPEQYEAIDRFVELKGLPNDARNILEKEFSSASGYRRVLADMPPERVQNSGTCGA